MFPLTVASLIAGRVLDLETNNSTSSGSCVNGTILGIPVSIRAVVGVTCILSMVGAVLIILSYILISDIRTKAREILVNLSLMDFMAATANLVGIFTTPDVTVAGSIYNNNSLCIAQASFAMYGTISSVLWTICVAVYVFVRILLENSKWAKRTVYSFYLICYGIPLIMTLWFALSGKLGNDPIGGSGWCSLIVHDHNGALPFNVVFGNNIWIYLTMILVPLIFVSLHFHIRHQVKAGRTILTQNLSSAVQSVERKLILIPVIFILLRIWSLLFVLLVVEGRVSLNCGAILFFLHIGGIGDSGQGFANAVLFVLFTPKVRRYFMGCCRSPARCCRGNEPLYVKKAQYGSITSDPDSQEDYSAATLSETSAMNEQDVKSLLVNAS